MILTRTRLRKFLSYNPTTGVFTWRLDGRNQHQRKGKPAGCLDPIGRVKIGFEGTRYLASRLAFLYMTGRWPRVLIDHKNGNHSDNSWSNLREADQSQNLQNMKRKATNKLGFKGVILCRYTGRYRVRIKLNYQQIHIGRFDTAEEAHAAYLAAAKMYFGEFARAE